MPEIQAEVDVTTACSLLENEYRRRTLRTLANGSGTATRRELARALARDGRRATERVEAALYHTHLPKLADGRAIRYDADSERVTLTDDGERLLGCVEAMERELCGRR